MRGDAEHCIDMFNVGVIVSAMNRTFILALTISFLTVFCALAKEDPVQQSSQTAHDVDIKLELDDGKRWPVHEHMNETIVNMAKLLQNSPPITSTNDVQALASALQKEMGILVSSCTMSGAAHDQLHIFLTTLFPEVEKLEELQDVKELEETRIALKVLFQVYGEYFEGVVTAP